MDKVQWGVIADWAPDLLKAALLTLELTALSFLVALAIGVVVGVARSYKTPGSRIMGVYVELFRGTPLLVQLFFIYYGLAQVGLVMSAFMAAILGLGLNGGAYISEIIKGSMRSVGKGQFDAAAALGMNWHVTLINVVLPQALRIATPALVNSFSSMLKDTSLVSVLAITEMMNIANQIYSRTFRAFEIFTVVALMYFVMTYVFSLSSRFLEEKLLVE